MGFFAVAGWCAAAGLVWTACYRPDEPRRASPAVAASARVLGQLDTLEAEMGYGHAELTTLTELAERRTRAEQIACRVSDEHVQQLARLDDAVQKKWVEKKKKRQFARGGLRARTVAVR